MKWFFLSSSFVFVCLSRALMFIVPENDKRAHIIILWMRLHSYIRVKEWHDLNSASKIIRQRKSDRKEPCGKLLSS